MRENSSLHLRLQPESRVYVCVHRCSVPLLPPTHSLLAIENETETVCTIRVHLEVEVTHLQFTPCCEESYLERESPVAVDVDRTS